MGSGEVGVELGVCVDLAPLLQLGRWEAAVQTSVQFHHLAIVPAEKTQISSHTDEHSTAEI